MDLRRVDTSETQGPNRRRSSPASRPVPPPAEDSLQWVTARLSPGLVREIEAHAKRTGTTRSDAIREALAVGMETIRAREGVPSGRVEEILGALEGIRAALDILGSADPRNAAAPRPLGSARREREGQ